MVSKKYAFSSEKRRAAACESVVGSGRLQTGGGERETQAAETGAVLVSGRCRLSHADRYNLPTF